MTELKLVAMKMITGKIELLSGLHIGAGDAGLRIGGTDSPVIKNPHTNLPFIPGSSLKGKMRSLLEWCIGTVGYTGGAPLNTSILKELDGTTQKQAKTLLKLFGVSADSSSEDNLDGIGLTRLSVADANLNNDYANNIKENNLPQTEVKFENSINRISGTAISPRNFERVPAGAIFDFSLTLKIFNVDDIELLEQQLLIALKLVELDAIGGCGSRGYGRVKFTLDDEVLRTKLDATAPFEQVA